MALIPSKSAARVIPRDSLVKMAKAGPLGPERSIAGTWGKEPGSCLVGTIIESEEQEAFRGSQTGNKSRVLYVDGLLYFAADVSDQTGEIIYPAGHMIPGVFQWRLDAASQLAWFVAKGGTIRAECSGISDLGNGKTRTDYVSITSGSVADEPEDKTPPPHPKKAATKTASAPASA